MFDNNERSLYISGSGLSTGHVLVVRGGVGEFKSHGLDTVAVLGACSDSNEVERNC